MEKILVARHLDDIDDLATYGRDAPIEDTFENAKKLTSIADAIYEQVVCKGRRTVMFVTSPRLRAKQTAQLLSNDLELRSGGLIRTFFSVNDDLRSTEQGRFILPDNYQAGDVFLGLDMANKIFDQETHGSDYGLEDNIDYHFGDPIEYPNGSYKYPEIANYFVEYGESYRESLLRIYNTVLRTGSKYRRISGSTELVVVAHGQQYHLLSELSELAQAVSGQGLSISPGESVKLLWDIYKMSDDSQKVPGVCMPIDFSYLGNDAIMQILRQEVDFLSNGKML